MPSPQQKKSGTPSPPFSIFDEGGLKAAEAKTRELQERVRMLSGRIARRQALINVLDQKLDKERGVLEAELGALRDTEKKLGVSDSPSSLTIISEAMVADSILAQEWTARKAAVEEVLALMDQGGEQEGQEGEEEGQEGGEEGQEGGEGGQAAEAGVEGENKRGREEGDVAVGETPAKRVQFQEQ
ncbi:MAG: hypothetical protein M1821_001635 [Bathelium mastoideum]|nr:MAG: hypothetical protein M1821_001635 [Bathelium mastoideum]KAI9691523.1 MAG: hypothetical protein M1822_007594 [Bathelium mastoideum]